MIELTGNPQVDKGIISFSNRRQHWYAIQHHLEVIVKDSKTDKVSNPEEFEMIAEIRNLLDQIKVAK